MRTFKCFREKPFARTPDVKIMAFVIPVAGLILMIAAAYVADFVLHRTGKLDAGAVFDHRSERIAKEVIQGWGPKRADNVAGPFILLALHLQLLLLAYLGSLLRWNVVTSIGMVVLAATRIRALQEATHYAMHGTLTQNRALGLTCAHWAFQLPFLRPAANDRVLSHVIEHHPNVNNPESDPNLAEYIDLGFRPGLGFGSKIRLLLYPLTWRGLRGTLLSCWARVQQDTFRRLVAVAVLSAALYSCGGIRGVFLCYLLPAVTVYPLFAWWSQLVEHRWYQRIQGTPSEREFSSGRVIDVGFIRRRAIELTVLPFGDSLHLAHSLYPSVRWNYLPALHRIHQQADWRYRSLLVGGLFFSSRGRPSLLKDALLNFGEPVIQRTVGAPEGALLESITKCRTEPT
jgi:fatty acid desaturase